jgi:hypothetical protein
MKLKSKLIPLAILLLFLPSLVKGSPFSYVPGTLIEDRIFDSFTVIIEEGYYFLVFDNTGYITDNYTRLDSYVIFTLDFVEDGINDIDSQRLVNNGSYSIITFNFEVSGIYVTECTFEMVASERISVFLTDYHGLAEYLDEIAHLTVGQNRRDMIIVAGISSGVIAALIVTIVFIRYRIFWKIKRRYNAYKVKKSGAKFKNIG